MDVAGFGFLPDRVVYDSNLVGSRKCAANRSQPSTARLTMIFDVGDDRSTCNSSPLEPCLAIRRPFRDAHVAQAWKARIEIRMIPGASIDDDNLALLDSRLGENAFEAQHRPVMERAG